jgi:hypothetical protein
VARSRPHLLAGLLVGAAGAAALLVACSPAGPATASPIASPPASAPPSVSPSVSLAPSAPVETSTGLTVPIDTALLDVLPASIAGITVTAATDPSGADDPGLVQTVERMAQAVVIDPASGEFAFASVIVLEPGVFDAAFYRSWRDSFDEGACSQAGGVVGHAQAAIGGRTAYIGRCGGGVLTYHVRLDARNAIVSVSSLGASKLGEQLVAGLRP